MSWYCLTSGDERSAIKIEGYARNDDGAKRYQNSAALPDDHAPHHHSSLLTPNWRVELSHAIKGRHALWANPAPDTPSSLSMLQ